MNDGYLNSSLWDETNDYTSFTTAYTKVTYGFELNKINTADWLAAATQVIPLCRAGSGREYEVPKSMFPGDTVLPGYYEGYIKLPNDPSCSVPVCK